MDGGESRGHPMLCIGIFYMTPGYSRSRGQENTGEEVTLVRHPLMEVKESNRRGCEQTELLQSKW